MTSSNLRNNRRLAGVSNTTATGSLLTGIGGWAKAFGRQIPAQTNGGNILAEVVEDLFTVDEIGIAFPTGTLWVRTQARYSGGTGPDGYDDDAFYWVGVPATLPAAYTYNPHRNPIGVTYSLDLYTTDNVFRFGFVNYQPIYSPSKFLRNATGVYAPTGALVDDVGAQVPWGPFNFNQDTFYYDIGFASGGAPASWRTPLHPGYRNVRVEIKWAQASYENPATDTTTLSFVVGGTTYTQGKAGMVLGGDGYYLINRDVGPVTYAAHGAFQSFTYTTQLLGPGGAVRTSLILSPRVDIPFPWSTTSGNVHAPGGILPGYP